MPQLRSLTTFSKCDFNIGKNDVEQLGYDKNLTIGHMIDVALEHSCRVIIKNGITGKYYLKCQNMSYNDTIALAQRNEGNARGDGVVCHVLKFNTDV